MTVYTFSFPDGPPRAFTFHAHFDVDTNTILDAIAALTATTQQIGQAMEADLSSVHAAIDSETTVIGGAVTLLDGLKAMLDDLASKPTVDPAEVQAIADSIGTNRDSLAAAVERTTPATP